MSLVARKRHVLDSGTGHRPAAGPSLRKAEDEGQVAGRTRHSLPLNLSGRSCPKPPLELPARTDWAERPIHVYDYNFDTGMAGFFRLTVLRESDRWNPALNDFDNGRTAASEVINARITILDAVAKDRDGVAAVVRDGAFLPLNGQTMPEELKALE